MVTNEISGSAKGSEIMIIAIDFDGTIAHYDGWKGRGVFGKPIDGAKEALKFFVDNGHTIIINTCRLEIDDVTKYLEKNGIEYNYINHSPKNVDNMLHPAKQFADVYIDDRGICFQGFWNKEFIDLVVNFKPWEKKGK